MEAAESPAKLIVTRMPFDRKQLNLIISIGAAVTAGYSGAFTLPLQLGALIDGLGLTPAQAGLLGAFEVSTMALTTMVIAAKLSKWSLARVAFGGILLAAIAQFLSAAMEGYAAIAVCRVLVGIGCGSSLGAGLAAGSVSSEPERTFAWALTLKVLGIAILYVILPLSVSFGYYKGFYATLGLVMLVLLPAVTRLPARVVKAETTRDATPPVNWKLAALLVLGSAIVHTGNAAFWAFSERIGRSLGMHVETIGIVLAVGLLSGMIGTMFAGWLGTRAGRALPMVLATVLVGGTGLIAAYAGSQTVFAGAVVFKSVVFVFLNPYIFGAAALLDPSGRLTSLTGGISSLVGGAGIGLAGLLVQRFTLPIVGSMDFVACLLAAAVLVYTVRALDRKAVPSYA